MSQNDWQGLQDLWSQQAVDLPRLRKRTRWKTWRMHFTVASEWAATLFVWIFGFYLWRSGKLDAALASWVILWSIVTPVLCWKSWALRAGTWRLQNDSLIALLELQQKRAQAGINIARWSLWVLFISGLITLAWAAARHYWMPAENMRWLAGPAFALGWLWIWMIPTYFYRRAKHRELERVQHLLAAIRETE